MREVIQKRADGNKWASMAVELYCYRIKKYIGAYYAVLGNLDALIFTAGIGENSPLIRQLSCQGLENLGISIAPEKNENIRGNVAEINSAESKIKVLVIKTDEELKIAQETKKAIEGRFSKT